MPEVNELNEAASDDIKHTCRILLPREGVSSRGVLPTVALEVSLEHERHRVCKVLCSFGNLAYAQVDALSCIWDFSEPTGASLMRGVGVQEIVHKFGLGPFITAYRSLQEHAGPWGLDPDNVFAVYFGHSDTGLQTKVVLFAKLLEGPETSTIRRQRIFSILRTAAALFDRVEGGVKSVAYPLEFRVEEPLFPAVLRTYLAGIVDYWEIHPDSPIEVVQLVDPVELSWEQANKLQAILLRSVLPDLPEILTTPRR